MVFEGSLTDRNRGVAIMNQAEDGLRAIDKTKLPGKYKVWCMQFALYPRLAWPLTMYEVALSRVEIIERFTLTARLGDAQLKCQVCSTAKSCR